MILDRVIDAATEGSIYLVEPNEDATKTLSRKRKSKRCAEVCNLAIALKVALLQAEAKHNDEEGSAE